MSEADAILTQLQELRLRIDALAADDPQHVELELRRHDLQRRARLIADASRNPDYVRIELNNLERRLAELQGTSIKPSLVESHRWINDPSAYARDINRRLEENTEDEVVALAQRISELRQALGLSSPPDSPSSRSAG